MRNLNWIFGLLLIVGGLLYFYLDSPFRYIFESNANLNSGKVAKAAKILETALSKFPNDHSVACNLAKSYYQLGDAEKASKFIVDKKLLQNYNGNENFLNLLVDLAEANKLAGYDKYAKLFGNFYLDNHEPKKFSRKLVEHYIRLGTVLPDKSLDLWEKGYLVASRMKAQDLKETLKGLLIPGYLKVSGKLKREKKYEEALQVLNKAVKYGENAEISFQKGILYSETGNIEKAQSELEEAIQLRSEDTSYKLAYAKVLNEAAVKTKDITKRSEYYEKIKLLLSGDKENSQKVSFLNKVVSLSARYNLTNTNLKITLVGNFVYPSFSFKVNPLNNFLLKKYKIVFLDNSKNLIDVYESPFNESDVNQLIEVTSKTPVLSGELISAKLFLNDNLAKEVTARY